MQKDFNNAVVDLLANPIRDRPVRPPEGRHNGPGLFHGFWVEGSKELVVYTWVGRQLKAIVVPYGAWSVRDDILRN
jgi:hypothetical protein